MPGICQELILKFSKKSGLKKVLPAPVGVLCAPLPQRSGNPLRLFNDAPTTLRIPRIPRQASPSSTCVPQWASSKFLGGSVLCRSIITAAGQTHGVSHGAPNNSQNSHSSHNSHNSQTGVAQLYLRAAVVIKQLFGRLCTLWSIITTACSCCITTQAPILEVTHCTPSKYNTLCQNASH